MYILYKYQKKHQVKARKYVIEDLHFQIKNEKDFFFNFWNCDKFNFCSIQSILYDYASLPELL